MLEPDVSIVATQHPSLDDLTQDFLADLRCESRYFGPTARSNPKPFPSLIDGLGQPGGLHLAALGSDRVVGACRIDPDGDVLIAVARGRRGQGVGTALLATAVQRAGETGWTRLTLRVSRRNAAIRRVAEHVGGVAVDVGDGRVELLLDVDVVRERMSA